MMVKYTKKVQKLKSNRGWGYDIFVNDALIIHQDVRPAVAGIEGFRSKEEAAAIADLVVAKLENALSPAVSVEQVVTASELDIKIEIEEEKKEKELARIRAAPIIIERTEEGQT